ncbi:hypothetical protein RHSP_40991 (plasmid) [Rhizobium freirei PRF 81]|uniref:DUF3085 domain-containing protein n=1 Tax=Rhizobium freirei PRF 81 TaxID=363754 RepID=N6TTG5_9HYPH|nr:DUF3085 domain-containing protein [Rhizobium freirei]ENN83789.1 hypothetical protein RHSP_40991 [Rhizobium freirei PRF 81]
MTLTFPLSAIREVISRGESDAEANGGFRNPHYGLAPGKDEKPGLWLVGDQGIYVMSNGRLRSDARPLVVYAEECDPRIGGDWFHIKRRIYGGDDGVDFIDAESLEALISASPTGTHLRIAFSGETMQIYVVSRG